MDDKEKEDLIGCLLGLLLFIITIPLMLFESLILWISYYWVVLPSFSNLPQLSYVQMIGLYLFFILLKSRTEESKDGELLESMINSGKRVLNSIFLTLLIFGFICVIHGMFL